MKENIMMELSMEKGVLVFLSLNSNKYFGQIKHHLLFNFK